MFSDSPPVVRVDAAIGRGAGVASETGDEYLKSTPGEVGLARVADVDAHRSEVVFHSLAVVTAEAADR